MGHILKVKPVLHEKIWGGTKLKEEYNYSIPSDHTGEAWVISAHPNGDCEVENTEYAGKTVSALFKNHRELFGNIEGEEFPLLVKILDASDNLSVQVHPNDEYARKYENSLGKSESWFVLDADKNTKMVMGHHAKTKEELVDYINHDNYDELLNVIDIEKGDFFYIPSGTLHAICTGSLIYEAQQSSDVTYRVYDYHRKDDKGNERELHVKQSIDCIEVPQNLSQNKDFKETKIENGEVTHFLKCEYLSVDQYRVNGKGNLPFNLPFALVTIIEGTGTANDMNFSKGDNFIMCSDVETVEYDGSFVAMVTTL